MMAVTGLARVSFTCRPRFPNPKQVICCQSTPTAHILYTQTLRQNQGKLCRKNNLFCGLISVSGFFTIHQGLGRPAEPNDPSVVAPHFLNLGFRLGGDMQRIDHAAQAILIEIALSAPQKSKQKSRIMKLWEVGIIPAEVVENLFSLYELEAE